MREVCIAEDEDKADFIRNHIFGAKPHRYVNLKQVPNEFPAVNLSQEMLIRDHLNGSHPMGTTLLASDARAGAEPQATALVFDIDTNDSSLVFAFMRELQTLYGNIINLEFTGNRYHAWVFFEHPIYLSKIEQLANRLPISKWQNGVLCASSPSIPVSKQSQPVVFPWSRHHTTGKWSTIVRIREDEMIPSDTVILTAEEEVDAILSNPVVENDNLTNLPKYDTPASVMDEDKSIWDVPETEQRQRVEELIINGVPEGERNEIFVLQGYILLLVRFYPQEWQEIGEAILLKGIRDPRKKRERRRWWRNSAVPYYSAALDEGRLFLGQARFKPGDYYRQNEEAGNEIERLLEGIIASDGVLLDVVDLALYLLDLQAEAERHGKQTFFRGISSMADDLSGTYNNIQTLSRHLPFVVGEFRYDKDTGKDLNQIPIFRCVNKAAKWESGKPRAEVASEYMLGEEYKYLLEF